MEQRERRADEAVKLERDARRVVVDHAPEAAQRGVEMIAKQRLPAGVARQHGAGLAALAPH